MRHHYHHFLRFIAHFSSYDRQLDEKLNYLTLVEIIFLAHVIIEIISVV